MTTRVAPFDVAAARSRPARGDVAEHAFLSRPERTPTTLQEPIAMGAHDVGDFEPPSRHEPGSARGFRDVERAREDRAVRSSLRNLEVNP